MILLDTDHLNVLAVPGPRADRLAAKLGKSADGDFAVAIVSIEEQMRGWLAEIRHQLVAVRQVRPYERLHRLVGFWGLWRVLPFDDVAAERFQTLRKQLRVGSQDLKIAAIALVVGAKLLTANTRDFERVPGLLIEDWLD
jgi:tRNA(fMet)-specific endonuclease VapC